MSVTSLYGSFDWKFELIKCRKKLQLMEKLHNSLLLSQGLQLLLFFSSILVELCKSQSNSHGMPQELLGAAMNTRSFFLAQRLLPEGVDAVPEASLHQCVVQSQAAAIKQ